jgi:hypothetical protein
VKEKAMATRTLLSALLVVACLASCGTVEAAMRVWAVDDGLRIDPQTGRAFEDNAMYPVGLRMRSSKASSFARCTRH